jgi:single-stranded DNA-binding protein
VSLHVLATGSLIGDPVAREGARGRFGTATIRAATEDGAILVSMIAFGAAAERLLAHRAGETVAVAGRARQTAWTGRDGAEHHGLAVVVEQIASAAAVRRADADRRSAAATRGRRRAEPPADPLPGGAP